MEKVKENFLMKEKFSAFTGVYIPALLTMLGVIVFLRMGWIVGVAGLSQTMVIIFLTCFITLITAMSISAIASNMLVKDGGAYYMISNELGIELGSAIGIPLYFAQTFTICFCILGFTESLHYFFPRVAPHVIGLITLISISFIAYLSLRFAVKLQILIFGIILCSLASVFLGHHYQDEAFTCNHVLGAQPFWQVFAVFFPMAMGVESGISMSKHLKAPSRSIAFGSIAAVMTAFVVYVGVAYLLWHFAPIDILQGDPLVVHKCAKNAGFIYLGIWSLALASALGCVLSAPRTLQAIAKDGLLFSSIGNDYGQAKEPRVAIVITLVIASIAIYLGELNIIAPILTMILLAAYGMINLATGLEEMMGNPSWRPMFHFHWGLSFLGAGLCFLAMFMIDPLVSLIVFFAPMLVYGILKLSGLDSKKDDLKQSILFFLSRAIIYKLAERPIGLRSWRPNFLVFTRSPMRLTNMLIFTRELTRRHGFLTIASVFSPNEAFKEKEENWSALIRKSLRSHHTKALVEVVSAKDPGYGMKQIIESYGIGPLVPNTIVLGQSLKGHEIGTYIDLIDFAYHEQRNVLIFRDILWKGQEFNYDNIDLWWDEKSKKNSEFMVVLAHMLKRSQLFRDTKFTLKCLVKTEEVQKERERYFEELLGNSRMRVEPRVYVHEGMTQENLLEQQVELSTKKGLTFFSMRTKEEEEEVASYEEYYRSVIEKTKDLPLTVFTMSFEKIPLKRFFNPPS